MIESQIKRITHAMLRHAKTPHVTAVAISNILFDLIIEQVSDKIEIINEHSFMSDGRLIVKDYMLDEKHALVRYSDGSIKLADFKIDNNI